MVLSGLLGGGDSTGRPYPLTRLEQQAEETQDSFDSQPESARLARLAMRAWLAAGGERATDLESKAHPVLAAPAEDFGAGLRDWHRYLQVTARVDPDLAEQAGNTYFTLLEIGSRDLGEIEANAVGAARALQIAGRLRPILFTLSNEAIYEYFNGEFAAGDRAARAAAADAPAQTVAAVRGQFAGYRERAQFFRGQLRRAKAELRRTGKDLLAKPLKAYRDALNLNKEDPTS